MKYFVLVILMFACNSCLLQKIYWKYGGPNAIAFVGLSKTQKEIERYVEKEAFINELHQPMNMLNNGLKSQLNTFSKKTGFQFGQFIFGFGLALKIGIESVLSIGISNTYQIYFRHSKYIY